MNVIQEQTSWSLICFNVFNLINNSLYETLNNTDLIKNKASEMALCQLYGYIFKHKLKYGVLTSYDKTWYIKCEKSCIYLSETFDKNSLLKSMNYFIHLALNE